MNLARPGINRSSDLAVTAQVSGFEKLGGCDTNARRLAARLSERARRRRGPPPIAFEIHSGHTISGSLQGNPQAIALAVRSAPGRVSIGLGRHGIPRNRAQIAAIHEKRL